jgi:hypothetical protein
MAHEIDWYPNSRDGQIHMIQTWNKVLAVKGKAWDVPSEHIAKMVSDVQAAETILSKVKSGGRTASDVVQCNMIFKEMEAEARFIKKHYLLTPPLTLADFPTLLLSLPRENRTPIPPPTGQPFLSLTYLGGPHVMMIRLAPTTEPPDRRSDYGYALYRGIMPQGGATLEQAAGVKHYLLKEPLSGDELLYYRFTCRKKEVLNFDAEEAGMTAYFCARYENQKGEYGTWGSVVSAIIP